MCTMQPMSSGEFRLPTRQSETFRVTTQLNCVPLYASNNIPPGFFLHPVSQEFVPHCVHCSAKVNRLVTWENIICSCPEAYDRPPQMPITAAGGFYPLAAQVTDEREDTVKHLEPILESQSDIHKDARDHLRRYKATEETVQFITDRVTRYIKDALMDKPHRTSFSTKEKDTIAAVANSIHLRAQRFIRDKSTRQLAAMAAVDALCTFADSAARLLAAQSCKAVIASSDFSKYFNRIKTEAARITQTVTLAEITSTGLKSTLPNAWATHKLIAAKHWFAEEPSTDSSNWFRTAVTRLNTVLAATSGQQAPTPENFAQAAEHITHVLLCTTRTVTRLIRIVFEVESARNADHFWEQHMKHARRVTESLSSWDPSSGFRTPGSGRPSRQNSRGSQSPSVLQPKYPNLDSMQEQEPMDSQELFPGEHSPMRAPFTQDSQSRPTAPTRGSTPDQFPQPPPFAFKPSSRFKTFGYQFMIIMTAMTLATGAPVPNEIPDLLDVTDDSFNDNGTHTFEMMEPVATVLHTGKIVRGDFIYVNMGPRMINPHHYRVIRRFDTETLHELGDHLEAIARTMRIVCDNAEKHFDVTQTQQFQQTSGYRTKYSAVAMCKHLDMVSASLLSKEESIHLNAYMKHNNITHLRAPMQQSTYERHATYFNGRRLYWPVFHNQTEKEREAVREALKNPKTHRVLYTPGDGLVALTVVKCGTTGARDHLCSLSIRSVCKGFRAAYVSRSTVEDPAVERIDGCKSRAEQMRHEAEQVSNTLTQITGATRKMNWEKRSNITDNKIPRAAVLAAVAGVAAGVIATIMAGINMERINQHDNAIDALSLKVQDAVLINQEQSEQIDTLGQLTLDITRTVLTEKNIMWYKTTTETLERQFRDGVLTADTAINKLGIAVVAKQIGKVNPILLTQQELATIITNVYTQEQATLSGDIETVTPDLYAYDGNMWASFLIPVHSSERMFDMFEVTPIPQFSKTGNRIIPMRYSPYVAIQQGGDGYIPMDFQQARRCTKDQKVCATPVPVRPAASAGCGAAEFLKRQTDCHYKEIDDQRDFYHTTGNFTCFSVKNTTTLDVYCPASADPTTNVRSMQQILNGAACFTYKPMCYLQSHNGEMLLPSSTASIPYTMTQPVTFGNIHSYHHDTTLTEFTPPVNVESAMSLLEPLLPKVHEALPLITDLASLAPMYDFVWPTVIVCLLLIISIVAGVCLSGKILHRRAVKHRRYIKAHHDDLTAVRQDFSRLRGNLMIMGSTATPATTPAISRVPSIMIQEESPTIVEVV